MGCLHSRKCCLLDHFVTFLHPSKTVDIFVVHVTDLDILRAHNSIGMIRYDENGVDSVPDMNSIRKKKE
jgi:hypothetical protein